ncbi:MAG: pilus assembly protein PilM [Syntrophomonadaceae bacterium]|nr:pilus assembly protein PilM [Syntrophomonadaceae bacterium]
MAWLTKNKWTGLGLEMGRKQMRMVSIEGSRATSVLTAFGEAPVPDEVMENGKICRPELIAASLSRLRESLAARRKNVVMSLPDTAVFVRELVLPHMKTRELFQAARYHALSELPLALEEMVVRVISIRPQDREMMELTIVAARRNEVQEWANIAVMAGMKPIVEIRPLAVARAMKLDAVPQIILCLGEQTSGISYFDRGQLRHMRTISKGGAWSPGELAGDDFIIGKDVGNYPLTGWLADEIQRSFEFWGRNRTIPLEACRFHVTGRNDICGSWPDRWQQPQQAQPWNAVKPPGNLSPEDRSRLECDYVAAIGLALRKV